MKTASFGQRLKEERKRLALRQIDIAEKIGISIRAISSFETNQYCPTVNTLKLLIPMGFDVLYLMTGTRLSSEQLQTIKKKSSDLV